MEKKKNKKADLESKKVIFFQIGMVISLLITLVAFEWKSYDSSNSVTYTGNAGILIPSDVYIPNTQPDLPLPKPQPTITNIVEVDDKTPTPDTPPVDAGDNGEPNQPYIPYNPVIEPEPIVPDTDTPPVDHWDVQPEFPGGENAMIAFLNKKITYPNMARQTEFEGTVYVEFVVEKDGSITQARVIKGIGGGCDEEALAAVNKMPKWTPGQEKGKNIRVLFRIPVQFVLN